MILRCTARLLDLLGGPALTLAGTAVSDHDWYANLVWLDRRKCLLLTHADTLFPIFIADVRKRDLQPIGPYVVAAVTAALRQERLPSSALGELDPNSVQLARTASRSVLGVMTETALEARHHVEAAGNLGSTDLEALNRRLRRTLHSRNGGYQAPLELVAQRLRTS